MTNAAQSVALPTPSGGLGADGGWFARLWGALPSWPMITTKQLDLRRRRGLIFVVGLLTVGLPVIVLGIRLIYHAVDPSGSGPAGSPSIFSGLTNTMGGFGFIGAAALGATAGATDLSAGVFRHLVVTGRSRVALYLARIPAGLSIVLPLVAIAFGFICLVTNFAGVPQATSVNLNGYSIPLGLSEAQLQSWAMAHPAAVEGGVFSGGSISISKGPTSISPTRSQIRSVVDHIYDDYTALEVEQTNPAINEMVKDGLWVELVVGMGFVVGLGLGSLTGQRTVSTVLMVVLQILITPTFAATVIPYFINGQRVIVGIALDQLRPASLTTVLGGGGGHVIGRGALQIPPMPNWAMILVIVGWIVGWSVIGAWRMSTRDA